MVESPFKFFICNKICRIITLKPAACTLSPTSLNEYKRKISKNTIVFVHIFGSHGASTLSQTHTVNRFPAKQQNQFLVPEKLEERTVGRLSSCHRE